MTRSTPAAPLPAIYLESLGCAKNQVDSEVILGRLARAGFPVSAQSSEAAIVLVNTCGFIEEAVREAIATILELACLKESGSCQHLVVCGCLPQRYGDELARELPEVDLFLGPGEIDRIDAHIAGLLTGGPARRVATRRLPYLMRSSDPRLLLAPGASAYLKIAEGCSHHCTYCTIPSIRGPYRWRRPGSIVREAGVLARSGIRELVLVAQDTTAYPDLAGLLRRLVQIDGIEWVRLLYAHPATLDPEVLRVMADEEKVCSYLDLPLQHIAAPVLRRMARPLSAARTRALIGNLRARVPDVSLRTTFIVGFPGETERDFEELLEFAALVRFDHLGVFAYRAEAGTAAARMPGQVPEEIRQTRRDRLMRLQRPISRAAARARVGQTLTVLVDGLSSEERYPLQARTAFQAPEVDGVVLLQGNAPVGSFRQVRIVRARTYDLVGNIL